MTSTTPDPKRAKAFASAQAAGEAALRIQIALQNGKVPDLADAKILEAAGCYVRRNVVAK